MNFLHMKYALAVAETNSINKAADELLVGAPALSRAIKELESSLGVTLFTRSAKGMFLTPEGELFVTYAKKAIKQVDDIENIFKDSRNVKEHFTVSGPRASYISNAFSRFTKRIDPRTNAELFYRETNAYRVINNIMKEDYKLGILRYSTQYDKYYKTMMEEKGFVSELITEFSYVLLVSKNSPLADKEDVTFKDLEGYLEIAHADPYVPAMSFADVKKEELPDHDGCRVYVFERASQYEILSANTNSYMWVSPVPEDIKNKFGLVEKKCSDTKKTYKDLLIHKADYKLSKLDKLFVEELVKSKREIFK